MDIIFGKNFVLNVGGKPFGCAGDVSLSITSETSDSVGCREDAQAAGTTGLIPTFSRPTKYSWTVTPSALYRFPSTPAENATMVTVPQLQKIQLAGTPLAFSFDYAPTGNVYKATYDGTVYITDSTLSAPLDGESTGEFTFTGYGELTIVETLPTV